MAASLSTVTILGYIGNTVELRAGKSGKNYLQLSVGVTKAYKKGSEWVTKTTWLKVMVFGEMSEIYSQKLSKGDLVHVTGELAVNEWKADKRYEMYVLGHRIVQVTTRNKKKTDNLDHNYGVPEHEIDGDFTFS